MIKIEKGIHLKQLKKKINILIKPYSNRSGSLLRPTYP